jgi:hypothetical protein
MRIYSLLELNQIGKSKERKEAERRLGGNNLVRWVIQMIFRHNEKMGEARFSIF